MATFIRKPPAYEGGSDNVLKAIDPGLDNLAHALTLGDTWVLGPTMVNSVRVAYNRTTVQRYNTPYFDPTDLGIKLHPYIQGVMPIQVLPAFELPAGTTPAFFRNNFYQVADDVTLVRGRHQFGIGGNGAYFNGFYQSASRAAGIWIFDGSATGLGLADLLLGRITSVEHGAVQSLPVHGWYLGFYGQDTWRATERVTLNLGLRWEPYLGTSVESGAVYNFNHDNFLRGVKSSVFVNAPAGMLYPGDDGFPSGQTGLNKQWTNFSPRVGVAWDVTGDGRMALRASYALAYDFMAGDYHNINSSAPPFGNRSLITDPPGRMDDPYGHVGGDPHPIVTDRNVAYPAFGSFGTMDPDINSPRVQNWNVTLERQLGSNWGVAASYLGSYVGSAVGADGLQSGHLHGPGTVHDSGCELHRLFDQRQSEPAARALPGKPGGRSADRHDGSERRHRLAAVPRPEAVGAAPVGGRPQPERQLHLVALHGHENAEHVRPDRVRVHESRRPGVRQGLLRSRSHAPGELHARDGNA